jgi:hypothetical protein
MTQMHKECFFLGLEEPDTEIVRNGVFWLSQTCKPKDSGGNDTRNGNGEGWIAVNYINNLESVSEYPGLSSLRILLKDKFANSAVIHGIRIYIITKFGIPEDGMNRPMLAIHPTKDFLSKLDDIPKIPKMMVIPWYPYEVDGWAIRNNARL